MHTSFSRLRTVVPAALRALHFAGLAVFFGSIADNIFMDRYALGHGLDLLAAARTFVSLTSHLMILQALAVAAASGALMAVLRYGARLPVWLWAKAALTAAIFLSSLLFLLPAGDRATQWAMAAAAQRRPQPQFTYWLAMEDRFGIPNLLLFLSAGTLAIWRPSRRQGRDSLPE